VESVVEVLENVAMTADHVQALVVVPVVAVRHARQIAPSVPVPGMNVGPVADPEMTAIADHALSAKPALRF
jgi:hypothetical protein